MQLAAAPCAALGIILGHYAIALYFYKTSLAVSNPGAAAAISYADPAMLVFFIKNIGSFMDPFDLLFILLAMGAALIMPMQRTAAVR